MRLIDILQPDCVKVPLASTEKKQAVFELADLLVEHTPIRDCDELKKAIWDRELTRTTGIGHGIGIPHGKTAGVDQLRMAIGLAPEPIEFGAIDGRPVELVILLASPQDQTGPHIQALAKISRMLTEPDFREALKRVESAEDLYNMIAQHEAEAAV